ncbi:hypothetical protein [Oceanitalea stevensii]|uniref:LPXTG cell wall anchor domain-containing protein n=1 Tax=Oceanitalea stevensii TaxID=2763072 RepID=A0ABR8YZW2_9MICO|nr:hypothetical protein [Oceanitalea stevensii]MBD8061596.1 hypothetical protein [Oceanitalea stevensii]
MSRVLSTVAAAAVAVGLGAGSAHAAVPYDESIHLSWDGTTYTGVTTESFLGTPVTVPGDSASRTVLVRNDGPATGTLRASIVNVDVLDPAAPDVHHASGEDEGSFYDDLVLRWPGGSASFAELDANGTTPVLEVELAKGREVPLTVGYELPVGATSGNRANVAPRSASFDVLLEIGAELPPESGVEPLPVPTETHGLSEVDVPPAAGSSTGRLQDTGADVGRIVALAGLAAALGAGLALLARRRTAAAGQPPGH